MLMPMISRTASSPGGRPADVRQKSWPPPLTALEGHAVAASRGASYGWRCVACGPRQGTGRALAGREPGEFWRPPKFWRPPVRKWDSATSDMAFICWPAQLQRIGAGRPHGWGQSRPPPLPSASPAGHSRTGELRHRNLVSLAPSADGAGSIPARRWPPMSLENSPATAPKRTAHVQPSAGPAHVGPRRTV